MPTIPAVSTGPDIASLDTRYLSAAAVGQAKQLSTSTDLTTRAMAATTPPPFAAVSSLGPSDVVVDPTERFQQVLGAGAALSDASAYVLTQYMTDAQRHALLVELFSPSQNNLSMLRIGFGATDFRSSTGAYTYDDMPAGQTDANLVNFSISRDTVRIIPIIKEILAINPNVKIFASVWFAPVWMRSVTTAGNDFKWANMELNSSYNQTLAQYICNALLAYQSYGVPIYAVSIGNESEPGGVFSLQTPAQQTITKALATLLLNNNLDVRLYAHDAQLNTYSTVAAVVLGDSATLQSVDGIAFHGYTSAAPAQVFSSVRKLSRELPIVGTEWRSLTTESLDLIMRGMAGGWVIDCIENYSSGSMVWNLALDENGGPNDGDHPNRLPVITVPSSGSGAITRRTEYYVLAHLCRFLQPGARRCRTVAPRGTQYVPYSVYPSTMKQVAFVNPDGSVVVYCYNGSGAAQTLQFVDARTSTGFPVTIQAGDLVTLVWGTNAQNAVTGVASTLIAQPRVLSAVGGAGKVSLSWSTPGGAAPATAYTVYRGTSRVGQVPPTGLSFVDYVAAGTYSYTVVADSPAGPATSNTATATATAATAPAAPVATLTSSPTGTGFVLAWPPAEDNGAPVTGYTVSRGSTSGGEVSIATVAKGYTSFTDTGSTHGVNNYYTVTAANTVGAGPASTELVGLQTGAYIDQVKNVGYLNGPATATWTHTLTAGTPSPLVVAAVAFSGYTNTQNNPTLASVTYGGTAMTKLIRLAGNANSVTNRVIELWYLVNPPTGASTVLATLTSATDSGNSNWYPASVSFGGVNQTTPFGTPGTNSGIYAVTPNVTTSGGRAGDLVLSAVSARTSTEPTVGSGMAQLWTANNGSNARAMGAVQLGGTSNIVSSFAWQAMDVGAMVSVAVKSAT